MISRIIFILFSIIIFSCTSNNNKQSIDLYGVDFSYDSIDSISNIIENSSHFVLPGDGAFKYVMEQVIKKRLLDTLTNFDKSKSNLRSVSKKH